MTSPDNAPIPAGANGTPVGAWGDDASFGATTDALASAFPNFIGFFIALALKALGDLVGGIPFVGDGLEDILDGIADHLIGVRQTATTAQSSADVAYTNAGVAYTTAQNAQTTANTASGVATAAQTAASNAATAAATAQGVAEIAYENAQYDSIQFSVSTAAVNLYKNEEIQGVLLLVPSNRTMKITRVIYTLAFNNGTATIQLIKKLTNGTESVVHTTNVTANNLMQVDVSIDYTVADLDRYLCNVTAVTGNPSGLYCCLETVLIE